MATPETDRADASAPVFRVADLPSGRTAEFDYRPDAATLSALQQELDLLGLRKVRLTGRLVPEGKRDWRLEGTLGATVVQPCVATLAPVTTRLDEPVLRRYIAGYDSEPPAGEVEMPEDDTAEALPAAIDIGAVLAEALALALPLYPRADDAAPEVTRVTEPGKTPMSDEDARPFAGLAALRDRLERGSEED